LTVSKRPAPRRAPAATLRAWAADHLRVLRFTLRRLASQPVGSLLTCAVVALSLGLPATFHTLLDNLQRAVGAPRMDAAVTVYLEPGVPESRARELAAELRARDAVSAVTLITADQALRQLEAQGILGDALEVLESNPLPHTLLVAPAHTTASALQALEHRLRSLPEVDAVRLEWKWIERLAAAMELARRAGLALAAALAVAALLVIGNTIRLDIENRREEVVVARLLGATDAFVRRPFLHAGLVYGVAGALGAWLLVGGVILWLQEPVTRLAALYGSGFALRFPGLTSLWTLGVLGISLGVGGAWMAVTSQLRRADPHQSPGL
jgi:cell division transport system permease protein